MLRQAEQTCWTVGEAGLATEGQDDNLTVYAANRGAVLVTMDREFSRRRIENAIGGLIWLRCDPPKAAAVLRAHLDDVFQLLQRGDVTIVVSEDHVSASSTWE
jgi:predicted nuclease of predicted toxin-antitoxin system